MDYTHQVPKVLAALALVALLAGCWERGELGRDHGRYEGNNRSGSYYRRDTDEHRPPVMEDGRYDNRRY